MMQDKQAVEALATQGVRFKRCIKGLSIELATCWTRRIGLGR